MTETEEGSMFHPWGGGIRQLGERGFVHCLAGDEKVYTLTEKFVPVPTEEAQLELARRYFTHMAPATVHDAMYFFGTTAAQVKKWLSFLPVTSVACEGKTFYYIETDFSCDAAMPRCIFLAGFDQLMLGYEKKESLYLKQEYLRKIFNLAGIVMPPVLLDGQVAGRWKKNKRKLSVELFFPVTESDRSIIEETGRALWGESISDIEIDFYPGGMENEGK